MPYIKQEQREQFEKSIQFLGTKIEDCGQLNYVFTRLANQYLKNKGTSYSVLNEIKGVFSCASEEFSRRKINPYEDKKIHENGDVD